MLEPQNFGAPLADGGSIAPGKFYRIGERGPETLIADGSGTIINHALITQLFGGNRADRPPVVAPNWPVMESKIARGEELARILEGLAEEIGKAAMEDQTCLRFSDRTCRDEHSGRG